VHSEWLAAVTAGDLDDARIIYDDFKGKLDIFDNFGQRTRIQLSKLERNPKLSPDLFKFTPPKGADVVGE